MTAAAGVHAVFADRAHTGDGSLVSGRSPRIGIRSAVFLPYRLLSTIDDFGFHQGIHLSRRAAADVTSDGPFQSTPGRRIQSAICPGSGSSRTPAEIRGPFGSVKTSVFVQSSDTTMLIFSIPGLIEYSSTIFDLVQGESSPRARQPVSGSRVNHRFPEAWRRGRS